MSLWRRVRGIIWHYRAIRAMDARERLPRGSEAWKRANERVERLFL
jgi:hypothetical protein